MIDGGFTPAEIRKFSLADVALIYEGWDNLPPLRAMVASYLRIKPRVKTSVPNSPAITDIASLRAMFPAGVMRG